MAIRTIETLSGRNYVVPYYETWQRDVIPQGGPIIGPALDLIDITVERASGQWPPALERNSPLIVVANHPYGIQDAFLIPVAYSRPFYFVATALNFQRRVGNTIKRRWFRGWLSYRPRRRYL